jgi:broad specificity phosphatase PhoE
MAPTVHLVRHAQGYHNLCYENEFIPDPDLTPVGQEQCANLRAAFPYHDRLTHLIASPMRRTLQTCISTFGDGPRAPYPIIALDTLQELADLPADTGSNKDKVAAEFGDKADLSRVREGWNEKRSAESPFEPTGEKIIARAREARRVIREVAGSGDDHVVVVTHGAFLHFLTDEFQDIPATNRKFFFLTRSLA